MRFDSLIVEIAATRAYLFAVFGTMIILLHLLLITWLKLDDIAWKKVDYIWLAAAALGLLGASTQADRFVSEGILASHERPRIASLYKSLRATLADPSSVCLPRTRSAYSPPNFDEIVAEQQALCKRSAEIAARMPESFANHYPPLEETGYEPLGIMGKYEPDFVRAVARIAEEYRQQQRRYTDLVDATKTSTLESFVIILGPLLISFALALRITKVTGEIRNARAKASTSD